MGNFHDDLNRGRPGEIMAAQWLRGIDFDNLQPCIRIANDDGRRADRPLYDEQTWESIPGNNKNRDFIVRDSKHPEGIRIEIKTDFRAMTDGIVEHTACVYIEVNAGCIGNLEEVKRGGCYRGFGAGSAWFDPNDGRHADFYVLFLPLVNRDANGNEMPATDMMLGHLTAEEIQHFLKDENIPNEDSIITGIPLEFFAVVRWDKLKELLEQVAGIEFCESKDFDKKVGIALPLREITKWTKLSTRDEYDGRTAIVPICRTAMKETGATFIQSGGRLLVPKRLKEMITVADWWISSDGVAAIDEFNAQFPNIPIPEELQKIIKCSVGEVWIKVISQVEGIKAYTYWDSDGEKQEYQYFNTAIQIESLPVYDTRKK